MYTQAQMDLTAKRPAHILHRLAGLEEAGCTEQELIDLCQQCCMAVRRWPEESIAVGLLCEGLSDTTNRNDATQDVAGAIIRWDEGIPYIRTFFISRQTQFKPPDYGRAHFKVDQVYLEEGAQ